LISLYLKLIRSKEESISDDSELRDFVINFIIAGRDTTAQLLGFACYEISKNPEKQSKLLEEIDATVNESLDFDSIKNLPYTKAVLDETLRLWPPVPFNNRTAIDDDILPGGIFIPRGSRVTYNNWAIARDADYWDNPEAFIPERFLEKLKKT